MGKWTDTVYIGGSERDVVTGIQGFDETISGLGGNDVLDGGRGDDTVLGGDGDDVVDGGPGADSVSGGEGNDRVVLSFEAIGDRLVDWLSGDGGFDTLSFVNRPVNGIGVILNGTQLLSKTGAGSPILEAKLSGFEAFKIRTAGMGNDNLIGGGSDDLLQVAEGSDTVSAGGGNDTVRATLDSSVDTIDLGAGFDRFVGVAGSNNSMRATLAIGSGVIQVSGKTVATVRGAESYAVGGGDGNDTLEGGDGNDSFSGNGGNDRLDVGKGANSVQGGEGNDTIVVFADDQYDRIRGGTSLHDRLVVESNGIDRIHTSLVGPGFYEVTVKGAVRIFATGVSIVEVHAGAAADRLIGLVGNDVLSGGLGEDWIEGNFGDDSVLAGGGNDSIAGDTGNDTIRGDSGNDDIDGKAGNDSLYGGDGFDVIAGLVGLDRIFGDAGGDSINGGQDADIIDGGADNDTVDGGDLNDSILGGDGNDVLGGSAGNDTILGGLGNDRITGSLGLDSLSGGAGADRFVFRFPIGQGADRINDFSVGDTLEFGAIGVVARLVANANPVPTAGVVKGMFLYDTDSGLLRWDDDGAGREAPVLVATLVNAGRAAILDLTDIIPV